MSPWDFVAIRDQETVFCLLLGAPPPELITEVMEAAGPVHVMIVRELVPEGEDGLTCDLFVGSLPPGPA